MQSITRFFRVITFLTATVAVMQIGLAPAYAEATAGVSPAVTQKAPAEQNATQKSDVPMDAVNINTAPAEHIAEVLNGVGLKKAQAIVDWREQNGKFNSVEQLVEVKGIGESLLVKNRDRITLN